MTNNRIFAFTSAQVVGLILMLVTLGLPQQAAATPSFSRQMGMGCQSCHAMDFPALNSFGRAFRASGYTMKGSQPTIDTDNMSLPNTLNMSVIAKLRYTSDKAIDWPDEAALLAGGRLSQNTGYLMELGLIGPTNGVDKYNGFLSTKVHFNVAKVGNSQLSIIPFSTDGLGAAYGMEMLNTGAQRSQRPIENRTGFSAAQVLGLGSGSATGIAFAATNSNWFVNASMYTPGWGLDGGLTADNYAAYARAAYLGPVLNDWDTGFGVQYWSGTASANFVLPPTPARKTDGWVIDGQLQGSLGKMPAGFYASYGVAQAGHWDLGNSADTTGYGVLGKLQFLPGKTNAFVAYSNRSGGAVDANYTTFGLQHMVAENIKLELYNVSGTDAYTRFMLFAGF